MCSLDDLRNKYTFDDLADMHEALDILEENERRVRAAAEAERPK
jgi:hypothetical protein